MVLYLPPTSGGFLLAFSMASCLHPLPWAITSTSVSEIPFCPLLSLRAYVFFPWKFPSTFEAPVPVPLVPRSVPARGLRLRRSNTCWSRSLAHRNVKYMCLGTGDLKYCLIPRTNSKQNVELGRAPFSSPGPRPWQLRSLDFLSLKSKLISGQKLKFLSTLVKVTDI